MKKLDVKDIVGKRFGKLIVVKYLYHIYDKSGYKKRVYLCKCDCGKEKKVFRHKLFLKIKPIRSCGCMQRHPKHNLSLSRIYKIYNGIRKRCFNKNAHNYKTYGGRGITMCKEWKDNFMSFYNWAINNGYKDNLTIDRINNDGNYEPNNCRWATRIEQNENRSNKIRIKYNNKYYSLKELSKILNINLNTIRNRYYKGFVGNKLFSKAGEYNGI